VWLLGYSLLLVGSMVIFQYGREKEFKAAELNSQLQLVNLHISDGLAEGKTERLSVPSDTFTLFAST
jgi:hypothetical protein